MSDIDAVVARVRFALEHPNDDVVTVGDVTALLAAYESAVRKRDEVKRGNLDLVQEVIRADTARWKHRADSDRARAALRRVREGVEGMRITHAEHCSSRWHSEPEYPFCNCATGPRAIAVIEVLALLDREAPDAES